MVDVAAAALVDFTTTVVPPDVPHDVGLLFVHGIGEQKRFDHLLEIAADLAELMLQADPGATMTTLDRTAAWKLPPGVVDPNGAVPLTMTLTSSKKVVTVFGCREVWWADLGSRSGLLDTVKFWLWALGQWAAPIYRLLDAAKTSDKVTKEPPIATLPDSVVGKWSEFTARAELFLTALCALMALLSWTLAKRLFSKLFGTAPSPTLIVQYVGDVHTYEERAAPGNTNLSDPGFPRRVAIRRRMVTEMVAMGSSGVSKWFVVAHSLGTVVAYNGLTEIGHTLPNYLPQAQWEALRDEFWSDANCRLRPEPEIREMMPARPDWLEYGQVVNRQLLFDTLEGILTYGSPLDKFAALWPRIVATATDREIAGTEVFPGCEWINLHAPEDPVAANLDYYGNMPTGAIPRVINKRAQPGWLVGLAHVLYLNGTEKFDQMFPARQKRAVAGWLTGVSSSSEIPSSPTPWSASGFGPWLRVPIAYLVLIVVLWLSCSAVVALAGGIVTALRGSDTPVAEPSVHAFACAVWNVAPDLLAYMSIVVLLMGLLRWHWESRLNGRLLEDERDQKPKTHKIDVKKADTDKGDTDKLAAETVAADPAALPAASEMPAKVGTATEAPSSEAVMIARKSKVSGVVGRQGAAALISLAVGSLIVLAGLYVELAAHPAWPAPWAQLSRFGGFAGAVLAMLFAAALQMVLNRATEAIPMLGASPPSNILTD